MVTKKKSWQLIGRFLAFFCQERLTITWRSSSITMKNMERDNSHKTYIDFINFMLCLYMYLLIKKILQKLCSLWFFFLFLAELEMLEYFIIFLDERHTGVIVSDILKQWLTHQTGRLNLSTLNQARVRFSSPIWPPWFEVVTDEKIYYHLGLIGINNLGCVLQKNLRPN